MSSVSLPEGEYDFSMYGASPSSRRRTSTPSFRGSSPVKVKRNSFLGLHEEAGNTVLWRTTGPESVKQKQGGFCLQVWPNPAPDCSPLLPTALDCSPLLPTAPNNGTAARYGFGVCTDPLEKLAIFKGCAR